MRPRHFLRGNRPARRLLILQAVRCVLRALRPVVGRRATDYGFRVPLRSSFVRVFKELRLCERFPGLAPSLERSRLAGGRSDDDGFARNDVHCLAQADEAVDDVVGDAEVENYDMIFAMVDGFVQQGL